jgi:DNA (cytosine-5)-methyltransferase 1
VVLAPKFGMGKSHQIYLKMTHKFSTQSPEFLVVDLFCGAGGTTTGFDMAMINGQKMARVIACVNHDPLAIKSHWENHPEVKHFEEDIRTLDLTELIEIVKQTRISSPDAKLILWASLECTNFSKAKGGQARDADSRTLADHLDRYVLAIDPDYVQIENVVEFMSWGPMKDGKPVSKKNGQDWIRWKEHINNFGYRDEWRQLNSADFGAFTSRNRLFGIFAKPGMSINWPQPTHAKKPSKGSMFGDLKKWKAVKEVLDFDDEGQSIFNRKKTLVDASLERIYAGLVKFVAGGKDAFMLQYNGGDDRVTDIDNPCNTIPTSNRFGLAQTSFIAKYYSGKPAGKVIPVDGPAGTIATAGNQSLVQVQSFITQRNGGDPASRNVSIENPARTLTATGGNQELVNASFITKYYSGDPESKISSINDPAGVIRTKDGQSLIQCKSFLAKYHGNGENVMSIESPSSTLSTKDRIAKVQTVWFDKTFTGTGNVSSIESPAGTIMPTDKHRLINCEPIILNPSHGGHTMSVDVPCPVIIARQDKAPLYLIQFKIDPEYSIPVYEDDSEVMVRIKIFMSVYGIADIKMRMLKVPELLKIQGFPSGYKLAGNQSDQKKFIGNSVVPHVVRAWTEAMGIGSVKYEAA